MARLAEIAIARRFCGPPASANGGYACGSLARFVPGIAQVRLLAAVPLERPLAIEQREVGVAMLDGNAVIAEAARARLELDVPAPLAFEEAAVAARGSAALDPQNPYKTCFVCGQRDDGMHIHPGRVAGRELFAAPWLPDGSVASADGSVPIEMTWGALDCPSGFGAGAMAGPLLALGTLTAEVVAPIHAGERLVTLGWPLGREGRKRFSGSAIFDEAGRLRGRARAIWIELTDTPEIAGAPAKARWS